MGITINVLISYSTYKNVPRTCNCVTLSVLIIRDKEIAPDKLPLINLCLCGILKMAGLVWYLHFVLLLLILLLFKVSYMVMMYLSVCFM